MLPSRSSTSVIVNERVIVIARPIALRLESGAITATSAISSSASLASYRPRDVIPSSLVRRIFMPRLS